MASRRLNRQVRTDLLWTGAGFCLLQVVLALAIEFPLTEVRDQDFASKLAALRLRRAQSPGAPLYLALGTSRTMFGLQARLLCGRAVVCNFGFGGGGPMYQNVCLRRLLAAKIRPDFLFVEVNASALLEEDGSPLEERWLDGSRLRGWELAWLRPYHAHFVRLFGRWAWSRLLPCRSQEGALHELLDTYPPADPGHVGWENQLPLVTAEERLLLSDLARRQYEGVLREFHFAPRSVRALEDLLAQCQKENLPFALLVMPEGKAFRDLYPPAARAQFQDLLDRLQQTWHSPLIDARTWVPDDGFRDTHHLQFSGAAIFTKRLGREVIDPLLRSLPAVSPVVLPPAPS